MTRCLITGAGGQLGWELGRAVPPGHDALLLDRSGLDLADEAAIRRQVAAYRPEVILNAAAYTAVDRAEQEPESCRVVNALAPEVLARAAREVNARLVHVSTDYVFGGTPLCRPLRPDDPTAPLGVYGATKLAGEEGVRRELGGDALIVRTGWVYSSHGKNFVKTMLALMASKPRLNVVVDQVGTPTWAQGLAGALWRAVDRGVTGTHHWSDAGVASWYDFALAIQEEAMARGLLDHAIPIHPIPTTAYPTPARRPLWSVLDKDSFCQALGQEPPHWRQALRAMLDDLAGGPA